jgi:hypothetical protein
VNVKQMQMRVKEKGSPSARKCYAPNPCNNIVRKEILMKQKEMVNGREKVVSLIAPWVAVSV